MRRIALLGLALASLACDGGAEAVAPALKPAASRLQLVVVATGAIDMGTLGGLFSRATDVNEAGWVVGVSLDAQSRTRAFLWTADGGMVDLGTNGVANGINDAGQVVGTGSAGHAFLWDNGTLRDLGTLGGSFSGASAINNLGQVVGSSTDIAGQQHAFLWSEASGMQDLGVLGWALDINDAGEVVGEYWPEVVGRPRAFLWTESGGLIDLGELSTNGNASALGINRLGQVTGLASTATSVSAFLWTREDGMRDLRGLAVGHDISDGGLVVGHSFVNNSEHATVWSPDGAIADIGGGARSVAEALNETGLVAGISRRSDGKDHAMLWTLAPASGLVDDLITDVNSLVDAGELAANRANALLALLAATNRQLDGGNAPAAARLLDAFVRQVQKYMETGVLTTAAGQPLIDEAAALATQLGGSAR